VPQRRKRIALVADFGGLAGPEVLFVREGLSRDTEPRGETREGASFTVEGSTDGAISFQERAGKPGGGKGILIQPERTGALSTLNNQSVYSIGSFNSEGMKSENPSAGVYETDMARTLDLTGGNPAGYQGGLAVLDNCCKTTGCLSPGSHPGSYNGQDAYNDMLVAVASSSANAEITTNGICPSLLARAGTGGNNMPNITRDSTVRRLTPLECERLQGFPDGWTDIGDWVDSKGKKHKAADSPRYKALGNSIALPFWFWLLRRISAQYERPATLGSLFDGIGGFPLCWERCNGKGTAIWASEIEEFCVAVTKVRFSEGGVCQ
jgi:DNA (cytosine-5)-methyltransferase 1